MTPLIPHLRPTPLAAVCLAAALILLTSAPARADDRHDNRDRGPRHAQREFRHDRGRDHHRPRFGLQIVIGNQHHRSVIRTCEPARPVHRPYHRRTAHAACGCGQPHGYYKRQWVPPTWGFRYDSCGNRIRVMIRPGFYRQIWIETGCHQRRGHNRHR